MTHAANEQLSGLVKKRSGRWFSLGEHRPHRKVRVHTEHERFFSSLRPSGHDVREFCDAALLSSYIPDKAK